MSSKRKTSRVSRIEAVLNEDDAKKIDETRARVIAAELELKSQQRTAHDFQQRTKDRLAALESVVERDPHFAEVQDDLVAAMKDASRKSVARTDRNTLNFETYVASLTVQAGGHVHLGQKGLR